MMICDIPGLSAIGRQKRVFGLVASLEGFNNLMNGNVFSLTSFFPFSFVVENNLNKWHGYEISSRTT